MPLSTQGDGESARHTWTQMGRSAAISTLWRQAGKTRHLKPERNSVTDKVKQWTVKTEGNGQRDRRWTAKETRRQGDTRLLLAAGLHVLHCESAPFEISKQGFLIHICQIKSMTQTSPKSKWISVTIHWNVIGLTTALELDSNTVCVTRRPTVVLNAVILSRLKNSITFQQMRVLKSVEMKYNNNATWNQYDSKGPSVVAITSLPLVLAVLI